MRAWIAGLGVVVALVIVAVPGRAYSLLGQSWAAGSTVTMHMQMGSGSMSLLDGSTTWNQVGANALAAWNSRANIAFGIVRDSSSGTGWRNNINNAQFSSTTPTGADYGDAVAVTQYSYTVSTGRINEADVTFDTSLSWNSYRGNLRSASGGGTLYDVYRVAVHEFGHVLGLDHPDEAGQSRTAVMNSRVSDTDGLQTDDINGLLAIYGTAQAANRTPSVTAACSPCSVASGRTVTLTASASDPDGDSLSYAWTISSGSVGNSGSTSTTWLAPFTLGTVTATVTVTDSRGASASSSVSITVTAADRLLSGARLISGQYIQSPNGGYRLIYQGDGNLVLYNTTTNAAVWWTGTTGTPGQFILQTDGNLVIYNSASSALWFTATPGNSNTFFAIQNDGNVVLYTAAGVPLWHRLMS
jgi:Matrixin/PKD domain